MDETPDSALLKKDKDHIMDIQQFRYNSDNLGYLVYAGSEGIAIDGGAVKDIMHFAESNQITIKTVTNTHTHHDHTSGNKGLLDRTGADFFDCTTVTSDTTLSIGNETLLVIPTPGHTMDSVTFAAEKFLVTGDTLFNGTVGNCFSGDLKAFYHSLKRLLAYPDTTKVYAGHDYVAESVKYAKIIEPENDLIDSFYKRYSKDLVVSTLKDELEVNPYVRFSSPGMIENLKQRGQYKDSELERFEAIMEIY